ncbi:uncharacterized protein K452DRAFT_261129 [Aplosporella prunicola CBS 121167]|uniref:Cytochrome P450 n=1 Tax=Aplosporella prunicola CBS 121167 TaxID=1176127 RepID=A0A6A6BSC0_9PEZI|nr:uncharacterized protein K452DRAFT_261129 [Aplosporella prunicola CBS 121167]KAF2146999.1 hypothetical protein K452DRAFT_261129 [Aplosporella prunicola CBS 121167]
MELSVLTIVVVSGVLVALFLHSLTQKRRRDPREPPVVLPSIPIIGHAVELIRHGIPYYTKQSAKHPDLVIYSMDMITNRAYIVNSPTLVAAVQRNHRIISFDPFLTVAANRMAGIEGHGLELLREEQNGGQGLNNKVLHSMHPALLGTGLDRMNEKMIKFLKTSMDELASRSNAFDLHMWCRHAISVASTDAVYGKLNPYTDREIVDALWTYESNLSPLLVNVFPSITARNPLKARERLVNAIVKYYEAGGQHDSSELAYSRWKMQHDGGATTKDIAKLEAAVGIGILSNTVPSTFWTIFDIFSRPELLDEIRDEVRAKALRVKEGIHIVDLAAIRNECKLLVSSYQETLRTRSNSATTRIVTKDMMLNDEWVLKQGSVLQMPAPTVNRHGSAWGDESSEFNPRRFLKGEQKDVKRATAFLSFGASPHICPGRHFATGEILSLTAMMVLRYNLAPRDGSWRKLKLNAWAIAASMTPPAESFEVTVEEREEYKGKKWDFQVTEGQGKFGLVVG